MDSLQALYFFFSPRLALRAKSRVCLTWLIKRLLCRLAWNVRAQRGRHATQLYMQLDATIDDVTATATSDVIDCGVELHQGFQATPLPVGAKGKMLVHPL